MILLKHTERIIELNISILCLIVCRNIQTEKNLFGCNTRGVAQWLSASALGAESRGFDPHHPDHF